MGEPLAWYGEYGRGAGLAADGGDIAFGGGYDMVVALGRR